MSRLRLLSLAFFTFTALSACTGVDDPGDPDNEQEFITTVRLTFAPPMGDALVFKWADADSSGDPEIDTVTLANATTYTLSVEFLNEGSSETEDITEEIKDEDDQHLVLIYGSGVEGPATATNADALVEHTYADLDENDLPIGLESNITTVANGSRVLRLMLRHMPPEDGTAVKNATVPADFASGGGAAIGGAVDIDVEFPLTVN